MFLKQQATGWGRKKRKKKRWGRRGGKEGDIVGVEGKLLCNYPSLVLCGVFVSSDFLGTKRVTVAGCVNTGSAVSTFTMPVYSWLRYTLTDHL